MDKNDIEILKKKIEDKPYLYDLYRWCGKVDFFSMIKWLNNPKFKFVYLKRKCEISKRKKQRIRFYLYRLLYGHYMIKYGIDIGSSTKIGEGFVVQHIGGIAINNNVEIGKNVEILQGVTIGHERRGERIGSPKIGDNVWIGSNAVIVGNIKIGNNVLIAPNSFINFNVPNDSIVIGSPGKIINCNKATENYINNTIL